MALIFAGMLLLLLLYLPILASVLNLRDQREPE
jgi:hypothetical protein